MQHMKHEFLSFGSFDHRWMCMEDNADVKCDFHFDKNKKKETQVPLFVSGGNCSIYLKTKNESKWFSIPYWYKYEIVFRKSNVSISFLLAFMKTPGFGFKKNKKGTNMR